MFSIRRIITSLVPGVRLRHQERQRRQPYVVDHRLTMTDQAPVARQKIHEQEGSERLLPSENGWFLMTKYSSAPWFRRWDRPARRTPTDPGYPAGRQMHHRDRARTSRTPRPAPSGFGLQPRDGGVGFFERRQHTARVARWGRSAAPRRSAAATGRCACSGRSHPPARGPDRRSAPGRGSLRTSRSAASRSVAFFSKRSRSRLKPCRCSRSTRVAHWRKRVPWIDLTR